MANNKKTKKQNRRRTQAQPNGPKQPKAFTSKTLSGPLKAVRSSHHAASCSILDPFCAHAKGARRPDGLSSQTMPYQVRTTVPISTGANGNARTLFVSGWGKYGFGHCTIDATSNTVPAAWSDFGAGSAFLNANASEVRVVSFGVRLISTLSAVDSKGYVIVGTMANPNCGHVQANGRTAYPEHSLRPLTSGFETTWISKPAGSSAHAFKLLSAVSSTQSDYDWTCLSVELGGGPLNTTCLMAEIIVNVELTFHESSGGLTALIPPVKAANPVALHVQRQVQSAIPSIFDTTVANVGRVIENKVATALPELLAALLPF